MNEPELLLVPLSVNQLELVLRLIDHRISHLRTIYPKEQQADQNTYDEVKELTRLRAAAQKEIDRKNARGC